MAMASKHTPGPWSVDVGGRNQRFILASRSSDLKYIARVHPMGSGVAYNDGDQSEIPSDEAKANARLIAAAPDLLEAMSDLLDGNSWDVSHTALIIGDDAPSRIERARSALSKARGEI